MISERYNVRVVALYLAQPPALFFLLDYVYMSCMRTYKKLSTLD